VHKAASTVLEFLRPIPSVALIPLAILLYGRGTEMKVALVIYACVWPILLNTIYGIRSVDPVAVDTARVFGLGKVKTAIRVHLRSALPFVYTGVKIAASIAVILAVSAELLAGGAAGIGILMIEASAIGDQPRVYALTMVTGLIGLVLNVVFGSIERRVFPWKMSEDSAS
jgi:NitT/TauT family transport system permease protein